MSDIPAWGLFMLRISSVPQEQLFSINSFSLMLCVMCTSVPSRFKMVLECLYHTAQSWRAYLLKAVTVVCSLLACPLSPLVCTHRCVKLGWNGHDWDLSRH